MFQSCGAKSKNSFPSFQTLVVVLSKKAKNMPYNWRRSSHTSSESPIMRLPSRSSDSSESESPASVDYSHLQIQPVTFNPIQKQPTL